MTRTFWVTLNLVAVTVVLSIIVLVAALFRVRGGIYAWAGRAWARRILRSSGARVRIVGSENVSPDRPHIIVSNHQSWYDVFAIAAHLPGRYRFIAKKELTRIPLFGAAWQAAGHISIDRSDTQAAIRSLEEAGLAMQRDRSCVVIFPEGTRSPDGRLLPFKKGAFMLALHSKVDLVPTAVSGGRAILPKGGWRIRPGEIIVRFGTPIDTSGCTEQNRDELIGRVRREIETLLASPGNGTKDPHVDDREHLRT